MNPQTTATSETTPLIPPPPYGAPVTSKGRIDPFTRAAFTIYGCAAVAFLCSCGNGYDGSLMTAINGMPYYKEKFNEGKLGVSTGIIFSMYTVGQMCGSLIAGPINDHFGRRGGMFIGCVIVMLGAGIIASSNVRSQFIFGRFILGFGIANATVGAPTYTVEVAPPQWRGRMTAFYNTGWNGGAIPAAAICLATSQIESDWSWRIPLILQAFPAALVVISIWWLPESPRWLYMHGRKDEAEAFLVNYHGAGDPKHPIVRLQAEEFRTSIRTDGSDKRWWDFKALIATKNTRYRAFLVFLMAFFGQMSGNGLGYFNLDIYKSLGFGTQMQFNLNLLAACMNAVTAWTVSAFADRFQRRPVLVFGTLMCAAMLAFNAGFSAVWSSYGSGPKNLNVGTAAAVFFFLFGVAFSFTYTPLQALYPAECLETTIRAKGMSMKVFVISCTSFISLFFTPIALNAIGWYYMLIFVFWDAIEAFIWHTFAVETQGYTLEELDEIFSSPNPVATSKEKRKIIVGGTGDPEIE